MSVAEAVPRTGRIEGGYDAIVVGGEPEGLICATYLAKAGLRTILLERTGAVGGRFGAREAAEGVFAPIADHLLHHFDRQVIRDLDLYKFGLSYSCPRLQTVNYGAGAPAVFDADPARALDPLADRWPAEASAYETYAKSLGAVADIMTARLGRGLYGAAQHDLADRVRRLGKELNDEQGALLLRLAFASCADILNELFESEALKALLAYEACQGSLCDPFAAGGALGLLRRFMGEIAGARGVIAHPQGGVAAVSEALRRAAEAANVEIRTDAPIASIIVEWDEAVGVELAAGGQIRAHTVISAQNARDAYLGAFGPKLADIEFLSELSADHAPLGFARLNAILDAPPKFRDLGPEPIAARILSVESMTDIAAAFAASRRREVARPLLIELTCPSAHDETIAKSPSQLVTGLIYPAPFIDAGDQDAGKLKKQLLNASIDVLETLAPDVRPRLTHAEIRTPGDAAREDGASAFDWAGRRAPMDQWIRAGALASAGVGGFYFCGLEMADGLQLAGAASRRAAQLAIKHARKRAVR